MRKDEFDWTFAMRMEHSKYGTKSFIYIVWDCEGQGCGAFWGPRYVWSMQLGRM